MSQISTQCLIHQFARRIKFHALHPYTTKDIGKMKRVSSAGVQNIALQCRCVRPLPNRSQSTSAAAAFQSDRKINYFTYFKVKVMVLFRIIHGDDIVERATAFKNL